MKRSMWTMAALAAMGIAAAAAPAAVINSSVVSNITGPTNVSTAGSLLYAYNFGNPSQDPVVNGVSFLGVTRANAAPGVSNRLNDGATTLPLNSGRPSNLISDFTGYGGGAMTGSYATLLTSGFFNGGTPASALGIGGLSAGRYLAQIWINDSRVTGAGRNAAVSLQVGTSGLNGSGALLAGTPTSHTGLGTIDYNVTDLAGGNGQYVTIDFTLAGAENAVAFVLTPNVEKQINAFQLRDITSVISVPAPGALPAGLAMMALVAMRRRRRNG